MSKYFSRFLLSLITLVIALSIAECVLRMKGVQPGFKTSVKFFKRVDPLYILEGFHADSNGVFSVSREARQVICNVLQTKQMKEVSINRQQCADVYSLANDFIKIRSESYRSDFKSILEKINSEEDAADKEFSDAVKEYINCPINSNGFKSIEFKKYKGKRKSILLLGDSFTWGHSASNITNGFADLLLAKGYIVYNTGISGADPPQYLRLSQLLIPQLKPDYVVVNFYMGNDIQYFERKPKPFMPLMYITNAGNLFACPEGVYFESAQEAYDFSLAELTIPAEGAFNNVCSKTAIATLLWRSLQKDDLPPAILLPRYAGYLKKVKQAATETPYSDIEIEQIKETAEQYEGDFLLIAIPQLKEGKFVFPDSDPRLFKRLEYFVPPVELKHYHQFTDGHYNDLGHAMHAEFIETVLK